MANSVSLDSNCFTYSFSSSLTFLFSIFWDNVIISVFGINNINLLGIPKCVDVLAPFNFRLSDEELVELIKLKVRERNDKYRCVILVDKDYVS